LSKKAILVITDGIGYSTKTESNAFYNAKKPTYDKLFRETPHSLIDTSGLSVGLPEGQMGNSEVGHMSIGSGRVLYQDLVKISLALSENRLESNPELQSLFKKSDRLHLIGLMSDGGVHSHIDHFIGIAEIAAKNGKEVFLHLITDGRDVSPTSAQKYIKMIEKHTNDKIKIATISGRFYSMDRDNRWSRVQRGYEAMVEATPKSDFDPAGYIGHSYALGETDEFIEPAAFNDYDGMKDGDSVLTINFRSDRMREMVTALGSSDFSGFARKYVQLNIATITEYDKSFSYPVLFKKEPPKNTLAEVISREGLRQLHTAETEKYAHVTFFFDEQLGLIIQKAKENDYALVITSDHGNCEEMKDDEGNVLTNHTVGKVWCFVEADGVTKVEAGGLNNIAPTVLKLMDIEVPSEMDHSLI